MTKDISERDLREAITANDTWSARMMETSQTPPKTPEQALPVTPFHQTEMARCSRIRAEALSRANGQRNR